MTNATENEIKEEVKKLYDELSEEDKKVNSIVFGRHAKMLSEAFRSLEKFQTQNNS